MLSTTAGPWHLASTACMHTSDTTADPGAHSHGQQREQGAAQLVQLGGLAAAAAQAEGALQRDGCVLPAAQHSKRSVQSHAGKGVWR